MRKLLLLMTAAVTVSTLSAHAELFGSSGPTCSGTNSLGALQPILQENIVDILNLVVGRSSDPYKVNIDASHIITNEATPHKADCKILLEISNKAKPSVPLKKVVKSDMEYFYLLAGGHDSVDLDSPITDDEWITYTVQITDKGDETFVNAHWSADLKTSLEFIKTKAELAKQQEEAAKQEAARKVQEAKEKAEREAALKAEAEAKEKAEAAAREKAKTEAMEKANNNWVKIGDYSNRYYDANFSSPSSKAAVKMDDGIMEMRILHDVPTDNATSDIDVIDFDCQEKSAKIAEFIPFDKPMARGNRGDVSYNLTTWRPVSTETEVETLFKLACVAVDTTSCAAGLKALRYTATDPADIMTISPSVCSAYVVQGQFNADVDNMYSYAFAQISYQMTLDGAKFIKQVQAWRPYPVADQVVPQGMKHNDDSPYYYSEKNLFPDAVNH